MIKGLLVFIYRNGLGDCTNGGVSSKATKAVLVGVDIPEIFEPSDQAPALHLREFKGRLIAVPAPLPRWRGTYEIQHLDGWMSGGNYIHTSDSRFPGNHPIPIYDRREF